MHVVIFEDARWHAFAPFSLSRPVFSLVTGFSTLLQKQIRHLRPTRLTLWVRPQMKEFCEQRIAPETGLPTRVNAPLDNQPAILVHGRTVYSAEFGCPSHEAVAAVDGAIVSALITLPGLGPLDPLQSSEKWTRLLALPAMPLQGRLADSPADLIYWNDKSLIEDHSHLDGPGAALAAGPYHVMNKSAIWLGEDVHLSPGVVLDASKGPVVLAPGASIGANAVIQGPCFVGPGAAVAPVAVIRPGVSIGPMCKVGGEVSASILLGHSNKGHEGFLGHSYLGKWVNLGAGTTTSNLKNTYGPISLKRGKTEITTGRQFLGALIGDHAKTAILTRLMGGSYVGFCSMLASSTSAPRFTPSFTFWTDKGPEPYLRDKAVEVAQRVFARRQREWTPLDDQMMNYVADAAAEVESL